MTTEIKKKEDSMSTWEVIGYVALSAVVIGILANLRDIKRYIRISTM
jgi:hypothetical protein